MTNRYLENERNLRIKNTEDRMKKAGIQLSTFHQTVMDVKTNWDAYIATSPDSGEVQTNGLQFAAQCQAFISEQLADHVAAIDVIAAGAGLTRQQLLDQMAQVD